MPDDTESQRQDEAGDPGMPQQNISGESEKPDDQRQSEAGGGDSPQGQAEHQSESDTETAAGGGAGGDSTGEDDDEQSKAKKVEEEREQAAEHMKEIEENPPEKLEDWPDDKAKYETFGGPEGEHAYDEGPEEKLGPSSLRHHEDGKVSVGGEEVDDASDYKAEPIPGGPTDPEAEDDSVSAKTKVKMEQEGADFGEASSDKMDNPYINEAREKAGEESGDGESGDGSSEEQQESSGEQEERQEA